MCQEECIPLTNETYITNEEGFFCISVNKEKKLFQIK